MRRFEDKERVLAWVRYDKAKEKECQKAIAEMNSWSDNPSIKRFIIDGMPCGDFFISTYASVKNPAFIDSSDLKEQKKLDSFLYFLYDLQNFQNFFGATILNLEEDELDIEYLVINPNFQNKGIGARVLTSLKEHMTVLSEDEKSKIVTALVDKENSPSIKLFSRVCKPVESREVLGNTNKFWFFTSREMEKEN